MTSRLHFLDGMAHIARESATWADGTMPLEVRAYATDTVPPADLVSSVRCVLRRDAEIMVIEDFKGERHVLPGGRIEANEGFEDCLRRELLEETGWTIRQPALVGFIHFHHLKAAPEGYRYPHPDFLQLVYLAWAGKYRPDEREQDSQWEAGAAFMSLQAASDLQLDPINRAFLQIATSC